MDFLTVNLTPGRFFLNLQLQKIILKLQEIDYSLSSEYSDFLLFTNLNMNVIKIRRDGSLTCKIPILDDSERFSQKIFNELTLIIQTLNPVYSNLIDINNIYLYWPDNYDFSRLTFTDYSVQNGNIYDGKYVSILNKIPSYSF
jgi:hypothetical protein